MAYDGLFTKKMVESLQFLTTGRVPQNQST